MHMSNEALTSSPPLANNCLAGCRRGDGCEGTYSSTVQYLIIKVDNIKMSTVSQYEVHHSEPGMLND
jgi:hypothetical protein